MASTNDFEKQSLGNICQNPRGEYDPETVYRFLDAVSYSGGYYMALKNNLAGTAPTANRTDENWFCCSISGQATPEYIAMYDRVVNLTEQVAEDAELAQEARENVSGMEENVRQLQAQAADSANTAEESKDQAAGYARAAESSRQAAQTAEANAAAQVIGFDIHVAEKTAEAEEEITGTRRTAVNAVVTQQNASVQAVKDQAQEYVIQKQNEAAEAIQGIVDNLNLDVAGMKQQVTSEGTKQIGLINDAGTEQLNSVKQAGAVQAKTVQDTGTSQVQAVNDAGTARVQDINDAGTAQSQAVEQKGQEVLASIPDDYKTMEEDHVSWSQWFDLHRMGWHGGVEYTKDSLSPLGTKTGDNAELVMESSTNTTKGRNDYEGNLLFDGVVCNGYIDAEGEPHITAIEGSSEFSKDGSNGDVWVAFLTGFYNTEKYLQGDWDWRDTPASGYAPEPHAVRPDGTYRSFYLISKYPGVLGSDGQVASISGKPCIRNVSQNNQIDKIRPKGTQYCGLTSNDIFWFQWQYEMKYATRNSETNARGCTAYTTQTPATVEETGVKRIIIATSQASNLIVGSYVSIGHGYLNNGTVGLDRGNAAIHELADDVKILAIEEYDATNSAVYVDAPLEFDTTSKALSDALTSPAYLSTMHWWSGSCDQVQGSDGSPHNVKSGKEPFVLSKVEMGHGGYVVVADIILSGTYDANADTYSQTPYIADDSAKIAKTLTDDFTELAVTIPDSENAWKYISKMQADPRYPFIQFPKQIEGSSSTGYCDALHTGSKNTSLREWLWFGGLGDWSCSGLRCVSAYAGVASAGWYLLLRLSYLRRGVAA